MKHRYVIGGFRLQLSVDPRQLVFAVSSFHKALKDWTHSLAACVITCLTHSSSTYDPIKGYMAKAVEIDLRDIAWG